MTANSMSQQSDLRRGFSALAEALFQLDHAMESRARDDLFKPIGDALGWILFIDDALGKPRQAEDSHLVDGLRYARNHLHNLVACHEIGGGFSFPLRFPLTSSFNVTWQSPNNLPAPSKPQPKQEREYGNLVGQPVTETLRKAEQLLLQQAALQHQGQHYQP